MLPFDDFHKTIKQKADAIQNLWMPQVKLKGIRKKKDSWIKKLQMQQVKTNGIVKKQGGTIHRLRVQLKTSKWSRRISR